MGSLVPSLKQGFSFTSFCVVQGYEADILRQLTNQKAKIASESTSIEATRQRPIDCLAGSADSRYFSGNSAATKKSTAAVMHVLMLQPITTTCRFKHAFVDSGICLSPDQNAPAMTPVDASSQVSTRQPSRLVGWADLTWV